jgi:uncharacterized protein
MFRLVLLAVIVYVLFKWLRRGAPSVPRAGTSDKPVGRIEEMVQDPVCGTWVPASQALSLPREKETLFFCSGECRDKFLKSQAESKN